MSTAYLYCRVSTKQQAEDGVSLDTQLADGRQWAAANGFAEVVECVEAGVSGTTMDRPVLQDMLAAVTSGDTVVVWKSDRFSRDNLERGIVIRELKRRGVRLVAVTQPMVGEDSPEAELVENVIGSVAQFESRLIGARTRRAHRHLAEQGRPTSGPPFGYNPDWTINGAEAAVIAHIDDSYLAGKGYVRIAQDLNDEGTPSPTGTDWWPNVVVQILERPTYSGVRRWGKKPNRNKKRVIVSDSECVFADDPTIPVIRNREVFDLIAAERQRRRTKPKGPATTKFGGLIDCSFCGSGMQAKNVSYKSKKYRYYVCGRHRETGTCRWNSLPERKLEEALRSEVERIVGSETEVTVSPDIDSVGIERELTDLDRRRQRLLSAFEAGVLPLDDLDPRLDTLRKRREVLESRQKAAGDPVRVPVRRITALLSIPDDSDRVQRWAHRTIENMTWNAATQQLTIDWKLV